MHDVTLEIKLGPDYLVSNLKDDLINAGYNVREERDYRFVNINGARLTADSKILHAENLNNTLEASYPLVIINNPNLRPEPSLKFEGNLEGAKELVQIILNHNANK